MLKSLEFENFKSWGGRHRLDFGRITGLFGANSSGKSSIIHLLLLLKQTAESSHPTRVLNFGGEASDYVDFGSFRDVVTDHDINKEISYSINFNLTSENLQQVNSISTSSTLKTVPGEYGENVVISNFNYNIRITSEKKLPYFDKRSGVLSITAERGRDGIYTLARLFDENILSVGSQALFGLGIFGAANFRPYDQQMLAEESFTAELQVNRSPLDIYKEIDRIADQAFYHTEDMFRRMVYLGPMRTYPRRNYPWTGVAPATVGQRGEQAIQLLLADKSERIHEVSKWMRTLRMADSFSLERVGDGARIWEAIIEQRDGGTTVNLADVGFGVSQVLPVIVALLSAPPGSLVILEHPEIHLHPSAQSGLADLLIDVASAGEIQILVESHSEHLLARIQRRIAESSRGDGSLKPEDVRLYFCEQEQGKSKLTPLEMQPSGVITNWPRDFFGDMLAERMAMSGFYPKSDDRATDD